MAKIRVKPRSFNAIRLVFTRRLIVSEKCLNRKFELIRKDHCIVLHQRGKRTSEVSRISKNFSRGQLFLAASLALLIGIGGQPWMSSMAVAAVFLGVLLIMDAVGLLRIKAWAWYLVIVLNLLGLVNNYALLSNPMTFVIPLEPLVIVYLVIRRNVFRI